MCYKIKNLDSFRFNNHNDDKKKLKNELSKNSNSQREIPIFPDRDFIMYFILFSESPLSELSIDTTVMIIAIFIQKMLTFKVIT